MCRDSRKKQNLKCVRYNVNGECRVLLVATRDIAQGERLYYDYNGDEYEYPTHYFIWLLIYSHFFCESAEKAEVRTEILYLEIERFCRIVKLEKFILFFLIIVLESHNHLILFFSVFTLKLLSMSLKYGLSS